jgi:hypothetical protein
MISLTVLAVTFATAAMVGAEEPGEEIDSPLMTRPFNAGIPKCGWCSQGCSSGHHEFESDQEEGPDDEGDGEHGCQEGWCSSEHPANPGCYAAAPVAFNELNERVWIAATERESSVDDLFAIFEEFGENALLNEARGAVQVRGCDNTIILSIPLTEAQLEALEE